MTKILFRFDANPLIGYGHFMRCQALAQALDKTSDANIKFLMRDKVETAHPVIVLQSQYEQTEAKQYVYESIENEIKEVVRILENEKPDCLIVDNYGVSKNYFKALRRLVPVIVLFDDCDPSCKTYPIDVVLNGNCYGERLDYGQNKHLLLGSSYGILRNDFTGCKKRLIRDEVKEITVTTGGSDPRNVTSLLVEMLKNCEVAKHVKKNIVIGGGFTKTAINQIQKAIEKLPDFQIQQNVDMKRLMESSDLWISSSGSTLNELAATGTPSISFILSTDQVMIARTMDELGITYNLGWFEDITQDQFLEQLCFVMENRAVREAMAVRGQLLVDGNGANRAARKIIDIIEKVEK